MKTKGAWWTSRIVLLITAILVIFILTFDYAEWQAMDIESEPALSHHVNRLAMEKSPYLLQHANNPVDWYPWGDEAFAAARKEDKPIFLSIGYSTCHWCHVMERESFEDAAVAELLNQTFICIKVDREERPDIDQVYMAACQMLTGSGGWPLTIIMTPDKKPFYTATYIPKESRYDRMGLLELIPKIAELWQAQREEIAESADAIVKAMQPSFSVEEGGNLNPDLLTSAFSQLASQYDEVNGGFGGAPKFPSAFNNLFLLRFWRQSGNEKALAMVENTLQAMWRGGLHDHLGGGFHRYSVDREWLVPHFEKMLYNQAQITLAALECWQATSNKLYREMAEDILNYVLRDMTHPDGGFYSAEDADSEGIEGKFYVWTESEVREVLSGDDADLAIRAFNLKPQGNYRDESIGKTAGTNILHLLLSRGDLATELNIPEPELASQLTRIKSQLLEIRSKRVRPLRDDKILADWNGLMIAAMARAGWVLNDKRYLSAAENAANFILTKMQGGDGQLQHRWRDGEAAIAGNLDDYAFLGWGFLELYSATFKPEYLEQAFKLTAMMNQRFWDEDNGGYFLTADDSEVVLFRQKRLYDQAMPSGNSVALLLLLQLSRISFNEELQGKADRLIEIIVSQAQPNPRAFIHSLSALDIPWSGRAEIVIAGDPEAEDTLAMLTALRKQYLPDTIIILKPANADTKKIESLAPFIVDQYSMGGKATAYVCIKQRCHQPTPDVEKMINLLQTSEF